MGKTAEISLSLCFVKLEVASVILRSAKIFGLAMSRSFAEPQDDITTFQANRAVCGSARAFLRNLAESQTSRTPPSPRRSSSSRVAILMRMSFTTGHVGVARGETDAGLEQHFVGELDRAVAPAARPRRRGWLWACQLHADGAMVSRLVAPAAGTQRCAPPSRSRRRLRQRCRILDRAEDAAVDVALGLQERLDGHGVSNSHTRAQPAI